MKKPNGHVTKLPDIEIRQYSLIDYRRLKELYEKIGVFDPETDAEERLLSKSEQNPDSILVAIDEDEQIVGSVSIIEDGRMAILFRLVVKPSIHEHMIRLMLLAYTEKLLREYGYHEVHILAPEQNDLVQKEYEHFGFTKGNPYRWFWKKLGK